MFWNALNISDTGEGYRWQWRYRFTILLLQETFPCLHKSRVQQETNVRVKYFHRTMYHLRRWMRDTRWRIWLWHSATSRKVTGLIPDGVNGIFYWHNPSSRTMTVRLTQPLTEMSTRNNSWEGKGDWCVGLTTLPPSCADCLEIWEPQPPGLSMPVTELLYLYPYHRWMPYRYPLQRYDPRKVFSREYRYTHVTYNTIWR
jgi:hypothetical protein